jgi:hypothetical protein
MEDCTPFLGKAELLPIYFMLSRAIRDKERTWSMDPHTRTVVILGILALCAIVGIYYCVVRKLSKPTQPENPQPQAKEPTHTR